MSVDQFTTIRLCFYVDKIVYMPNAYYHYTPNNPQSVTRNRVKQHYSNEVNFILLVDNLFKSNNWTLFDDVVLKFKAITKIAYYIATHGFTYFAHLIFKAESFINKALH